MVKKNYLSHTEQEVWQYIKDKKFIDPELIGMIFPETETNYIYKILHMLYKKGYLRKAVKGLYYNPERIDSYWEIALRIHAGYLGLVSALRYHNLIEYEDFSIYVITRNTRNKVSLGEYNLIYLPLGEHYCGFRDYGDYTVSTPEKTIFDCFLKPSVGYSVITKALYDAKDFNWKEFIANFKRSTNHSLHQRTGYILELLKKKTGFDVPDFVFDYLLSKKGKRARLSAAKSRSVFSSKWNIQDNSGEESILGWWQ